ncbi:MAG TPA: CDP-diacylglycerol--serine O-phosphatidyltransferase [Thermoanaerobaculia bacterium]|nr:CDP-diacylglycerol--serine O-phosphatidyltransferase [Thermoanaerobaculia bacterium]
MVEHLPGKPRRGVRRGIYLLPAFFTVGNIFCGYLSLDFALKESFVTAAALVFAAGFLDGIDGRVARMTRTTSAFGEQLDSLADVISFGVAPSFLVYRWGLSGFDRLGLAASFLFLVCGACRLARFNVQAHVVDKRFFVGLPIPAAACTLSGLIWVFAEHPSEEVKAVFVGVTILLSFLMVSTFRYRSFKDVDLRSRRSAILVPIVGLVLAAGLWQPHWTFGALLVGYAVSAPLAKLVSLRPFARPRPAEEIPAVPTRRPPA